MAGTPEIPSVLYAELIRLARLRSTTTYKEIAFHCGLENQGLRFGPLAKMLTAVNERELERPAPLLAAVVINKALKLPGAGFFKFARERGLFDGADEWGFWEQERDRLQDYWTQHG